MKLKALIVDGDPSFRKVLRDQLEAAGFFVLEAEDGEEGCRLAQASLPDVILIDPELPKLDGIEVCRLLRSQATFEHTAIFLTPSFAELGNAGNLRVDDHLGESLDFTNLVARIRGNLARKRTAEALACIGEASGESKGSAGFIRRLEEELRVKAVYEELFENASEGLAAFDRQGKVVFVNRKGLEVAGYERRELEGVSLVALLALSSLRSFLKRRGREEGKGASQFDVSLRTKAGDSRLLAVSLNERPLHGGLWVAAFRDVTEERRTAEELQAAKAALEKANERLRGLDLARSRFLNTAAHELRVPVTIVNGYCSLLREMGTGTLTSQQREFLDAAVESSDRLVELINNMLDLSRFEAGKMLLDIDARDLSELVRSVCCDFRPLVVRNGLEFTVDLPPQPCLASFDEEKIERVLTNLISNAVKFTPAGGQVRVAMTEAEGEMHVCVEDTGRGIPQLRIPELFEEFSQIGPEDSRRGSGLGLSICKKIVDSHQGRIWVVSNLGQGSRFTFTIPKPT